MWNSRFNEWQPFLDSWNISGSASETGQIVTYVGIESFYSVSGCFPIICFFFRQTEAYTGYSSIENSSHSIKLISSRIHRQHFSSLFPHTKASGLLPTESKTIKIQSFDSFFLQNAKLHPTLSQEGT